MSTSTHKQIGNSNGNNPGRFRSGQAGTHTLAERGSDFYPTLRIAVESLLNAEPDVLNTMARVWEPAAGDGNIAHVLRDNGIPVIASDIERYSFALHFVGDFLQRDPGRRCGRQCARRTCGRPCGRHCRS